MPSTMEIACMHKVPEFTWDSGRELRALRDAAARSRAEEASALRRSQEDVERCIARRQMDEGEALEKFCLGFCEAIQAQLERHRMFFAGFLENQEEQLKQMRADVVAEVCDALSKALEASGQSQSLDLQHRDQQRDLSTSIVGREEVPDAAHGQVAKAVIKLRGAVEHAAGTVAGSIAKSMAESTAKRVTHEACGDLAQKYGGVEHRLGELEAQFEGHRPRVEELEAAGRGALNCLTETVTRTEMLQSRMAAVETSTTSTMKEYAAKAERTSTTFSKEVEDIRRMAIDGIAKAGGAAQDAHRAADLVRELREEREAANKHQCDVQAQLQRGMESSIMGKCADELHESTSMIRSELREYQRSTSAKTDAAAAWRAESSYLNAELGAEVRELQREVATARASAGESSAACGRLSTELEQLRGRGLAHLWTIPYCMQRLRSLSLASDAGLWLDSHEFALGSFGPLVLRFHPRGVRGGDGQCAVGVYTVGGGDGLRGSPWQPRISVGGTSRQAEWQGGENARVQWFASGLGRLEAHLIEYDDLAIMLELRVSSPTADSAAVARTEEAPPPQQASVQAPSPHRGAAGAQGAGLEAARQPVPGVYRRRISNVEFGGAEAAAPRMNQTPLSDKDSNDLDLATFGVLRPPLTMMGEAARKETGGAEGCAWSWLGKRESPAPPDANAGSPPAQLASSPIAGSPSSYGTPQETIAELASISPWRSSPSKNPFDDPAH